MLKYRKFNDSQESFESFWQNFIKTTFGNFITGISSPWKFDGIGHWKFICFKSVVRWSSRFGWNISSDSDAVTSVVEAGNSVSNTISPAEQNSLPSGTTRAVIEGNQNLITESLKADVSFNLVLISGKDVFDCLSFNLRRSISPSIVLTAWLLKIY